MSTSERSGRAPNIIFGAVISAVIVTCFLLTFWNRFIGLRSGDGFFSGALSILERGGMPVGGFSAVPPLFLFRSEAVLALFGKTVLALRAAGIVERLLILLVLYWWLVRFFRARSAALAAIVTVIVGTGDLADPLSSYNHFAMLMAMLSGFASSYALDEHRSERGLVLTGCIAGLFSFLCIASKQTIGLGVTVSLPVMVGVCLWRLDGIRKSAIYLAGFCAAWLTPCFFAAGWMMHKGVLGSFLRQIFILGPAAKYSSPLDFFTRAVVIMGDMKWEIVAAIAFLLLCWKPMRRLERSAPRSDETGPASMLPMAGLLLLGICAVGGALASPAKISVGSSSPIYLIDIAIRLINPFIYIALLGSGILLVSYGLHVVRNTLTRRQSQFFLFATVSFSIAFTLSLSFPAFAAMVIPGTALFIAVLLEYVEDWRNWAIYAACAILIFFVTSLKTFAPFNFDDWQEPPVSIATERSRLPELSGLLLPANTVNFVDNTARIIAANSTPEDTIFIYPEMSFLYGVSRRNPPTISGSHNIDVVSDSIAKQEAQRLLNRPPAVLIYGPEPEEFLQLQEKVWRKGGQSGQREIIAAVQTLAAQYDLATTFRLYPNGHPVYVLLRPLAQRSANSSHSLRESSVEH